jgi:hypothetical protein
MRYRGRRNDRLIAHESEERELLYHKMDLVPIREGFYKPLETFLNEC